MADKVSIEQKIQQYRQANPKLKNLSDKQILSIMVKNGQIKLTEEQKNSIYSNTQRKIENTGLTIQKHTKSQIIKLNSGRKIVIENGTARYYAANGVELKKGYFEKQEGRIDVKPSGRYSITKAGKTKYYAANGTELNAKYFKQVESSDVKIKSSDGKTYNLNKTLANRIHNVGVNLKKAEDSNGFIGSAWSGFKNLTGIGDSSDKVKEQQEAEKKLLQQFNTNVQKRPKIFKQLTGVDYTPENLEKFIKGEIKLKSEIALQSYTEGQDMATDVGADIISGIAAVGIYTAAVAAAPFSGGASIAVGIAAAGASAAAIKTGLKVTDAVTGGREYTLKDAGRDAVTGAFSGVLAPVTGGLGGAVGKTVATKLGIQAVKQVGKEVAEEAAVSGVKQTIKTALTNPTGYEYVGGNVAKRGLAFAAETATDGAVGGAVDNAFRTAYDGGSLEDIGNSAVQGFVGGAIMSPVIGGGMKAAGKGVQKVFGKDNVHIDADGNRVKVNEDGTVVKIDENGNEIPANATDTEIHIPEGKFAAPLPTFLETDDAFREIVRKRATNIIELDKIQDIDEFCSKSFQIIKEEMGIADSPIELKITDDVNQYDLESNTVSINRNWANGDRAELFGAIAHELNHFLQWKEVILNYDQDSDYWIAVVNQLQKSERGQANIEYISNKYPDNLELQEFFNKAKAYEENWQKYVAPEDPQTGMVDVNSDRYHQYKNQTVEKESFRRGEIVAEEYRNILNVSDINSRLATASSREEFVAIRDEIKTMPNSSEKQTLQQEYLKKYNEVSRKFNEEFNIRMEYKPAKTAVKRVSDEQYSKLLEKIDGNQNKIANLNKLVDAGFEKETCEILLRYLDLPERIVDDYIQITKNENNRSQIFALFNNLFENKELKPNFELIHKQTLDLLAMENNGRKLPLKEITEIIKNTNGDNDKIKVYLKYTNIQEMGDAQLTAKDIALFIDKIYPESNPEIIEKINQILHLTPEQISNNSGKAVDGNFINSILNKNLSPEQITIIKDLAYNKNFADVKNKNIAIEACERLNFKKDLIELFDILYSSDIQPKSKYMQLKLDPIECTMVIYQFPQKEYIETFRLLAENCKDYKKARNFTSFSQKEIAMLVEYVNIVKNNKNLLENFDKQIFNDKYYSSILDFVTKNQEATIDDITKIMDNIDDAIRKEGAIKNTRLIKNEKLKELAVNLELLGKADSQAIEDISYKLNSVDDEVLTKKINEILNSCIKKAKEGDLDYHYDRSLYEIDMYLDAYHTLTGNYETTLVPGKFFTWNYVKTEKRNFYDYATSDKFYTGDKYDGNFVVTDKEKRFNEIDFPDFIRKDFDDEARVERLKDFLTSHPEDKTLNYLYKEYYLKSLPKEIDDFCNEITEKYGVHLFLSNDYELNPHALPYIKEEFEIWQKASTGKAKYPIIIDFSTIRKRYIDSNAAYNQGASAGFSDGDIVGLAGLQNTIYAIRHELTHHNESNNHNLGKYNIEEIMPHKINEEGVDIPDFENCSYREEFLRAGIAPSHIPYAYNNTAEFIAVAAEGDMSKYSPEFKQMLIDFGMPEWMLSMKQINPTVLKNSADMDFIINEAKKYPIYGENGEELDVTKRYDILSYFKEMYDECQHKAFLTSEELKRHNIPNEPKKLFEYILPRHEEKNIILGDMDLICKIMKGELDEVSPKVEIPAELVAVEESLITTLNRIVKAKRPKAVNHLENISEILKNPEDKLTLLSYLNENPNWLYLVDDLNFTPQNIRLLRELKSLLNEDNISFPALLSFLNNEKISNNLNTEKFMAFIKPLYEKGINLEFMSGTGSKQALEVVAEMFSRKSDDLPKVEYLLKLWESNQKDYPFYYTSLILNTVEDWDVVINRNLIEYKDANGRKLSYGDIFAYSKLTDNEWNNVLKRNLLSLKEDYGEHLTKGANDTFTEGNNDATYLAKLTDNEWNFVVNNRLLEKYNGFQVLELVHNTQNINGVEKSLLEIAMEKGIISIEDSKFPAEINPQDIEIMCNIENWSTLVRNNIFDSLTTRDYLLSINGSLGLKLEKLSTLTDDISWQRIKNHDLLKYENAEDIITLAQLDEDKFTRFIRLKDTEFSQYNKGIGELASLEPEIFAKVQKDLLGKVDSAEAICKLLKLEPEKYNYIVKNGLLSGKILHETTVDLIVNLRKFIGKKNLDELSKADKRELLWLLMENKQNFESSKFNFSEHDGALPLLKGEYKDIIDTVISDLGIYADDFSPEVKLEYSNLLNKLSKPQNNIDNLIDDITSLIPEFKYLGNLRDEITKTIKQLQQKADFHKLSDSDKKVLLTATLLEKCSTSSLDDSAFDASIIVRRLGFSKSEIKKVSNIIKNANLIADFMKLNKETLSVTTPVGVVLESDARQLQLDRIAFSLKESNTFEIAKMLYSTKETEGLGRHLDKLIKNRIQEIKALDFVLPQFTIRSWIEEMSKDPKWLEQHIIGGRLIIYKNELPSEYLGFVHCTDNTAATGGNTGTNIANFDLFAIPNDKVICASYISKENWGTFGGNGLLLSTGNSNQLVGAGYDIWSFGKDTDGILMEYYRDRGLVSHNGKSLKFKHRTSISDSLKEILFGVNYSELCEARRIQVLELENSFRPKILELNDNRIALIHRLARENNLDPNSITNKQYQELRKKYPEIIKIEQQIKDLETQLSTRIDNIKENSMIKEIDSKYIKRVDKLKEFDHPVSLAEIKSIDEELYNAYVEYFSRVPNGRIDDTSLLRSSYHNEVLLNEVDVDAYMVTIGGGRTSIYDAGAIPEEFLKLSKENNIPLIITN